MSATPTVYFIDDSATMREVIKIAFRRENINVVAYNDAASALGHIEQSQPDVVISDVIMPDKDGYEVCQFIKQHPALNRIPVILMSGVVNRSVAEKAFAVKADELIRKPFQPQDLITRVKHLLSPAGSAPPPAAVAAGAQPPLAAASAAAALSNIFQSSPSANRRPPAPSPAAPAMPVPTPQPAPPSVAAAPPPVRPAETQRSLVSPAELQKVKIEILRLEGLVKKLQSELQAEREYSRALEEHVKTLQDSD